MTGLSAWYEALILWLGKSLSLANAYGAPFNFAGKNKVVQHDIQPSIFMPERFLFFTPKQLCWCEHNCVKELSLLPQISNFIYFKWIYISVNGYATFIPVARNNFAKYTFRFPAFSDITHEDKRNAKIITKLGTSRKHLLLYPVARLHGDLSFLAFLSSRPIVAISNIAGDLLDEVPRDRRGRARNGNWMRPSGGKIMSQF